jgi:hypothetical protein
VGCSWRPRVLGAEPATAAAVVAEADRLYVANDKAGVYAVLVAAAATHRTADVLWRLARAEHDLALVTVRPPPVAHPRAG